MIINVHERIVNNISFAQHGGLIEPTLIIRELDISDDLQEKYDDIIAHRYQLWMENLGTGQIGITIFDPHVGEDIAETLFPEGNALEDEWESFLSRFDIYNGEIVVSLWDMVKKTG